MVRHRRDLLALLALTLLDRVAIAGQGAAPPDPPRPAYHREPYSAERQRGLAEEQVGLLEKLNRRGREHLARLTEVVAPDVWTYPELTYSPLPAHWTWAAGHPKALVVHQPSQEFGAYEHGRLIYWGPISSGREETPTPSGLFHLTWKAKSRRSTDNQEWLLNWYFNFVNSRGVSFHEFELPGRPASHACVRLLTRDARWLYGWGEQWQLSADGREVLVPGTPVAVLGVYDFARPAPWLALDAWAAPLVLPDDPGATVPRP